MNKITLSLALSLVITLVGCVTTGTVTPASVDAYIQSHSKMLSDGTASVTKFALSLAQKDPVKRLELKEDINQIVEKVERASTVAYSTASGTLTPDQLCEALKVRDESVQAFFDGIVALYQNGYEKMEASGRLAEAMPWIRVILDSLKVLATGLNKATTVPVS